MGSRCATYAAMSGDPVRAIAAFAIKDTFVMGKTAIILIGFIIAWSWMTHQSVGPGSYRDSEVAVSEREPPSRSTPSRTDEHLDTVRELGGVLWEQLLRPTLVAAATFTLDTLSRLLATVADELPGEHSGHGSLASRQGHADR
jgi:hypothetical protein